MPYLPRRKTLLEVLPPPRRSCSMSIWDLPADDFFERLADSNLFRHIGHADGFNCKRCDKRIFLGTRQKKYCAACHFIIQAEQVSAAEMKRAHPCADCPTLIRPQFTRCDACSRKARSGKQWGKAA